ncbi:M4 family metallopeptidase [Longispora urticae]
MRRILTLALVVGALAVTEPRTAQAGPPAGVAVERVRVDVDPSGATHARHQRTYRGMAVLGGDFIVHTASDGRPDGVTDNLLGPLSVADRPRVTAVSAAARAVSIVGGAAQPKGESRLVVDAVSGRGTLAWLTAVAIPGTADNTIQVLTDATDGTPIRSWSQQVGVDGIGHSIYSGQVALDTTRRGPFRRMTDPYREHSTCDAKHTKFLCLSVTGVDDEWGDGTNRDEQSAAVDAHYGIAATYDYYHYLFGRDGFAGDGRAPDVRVHYGDKYNAGWDEESQQIWVGDGRDNARPVAQVDVMAHEFTHGVTRSALNVRWPEEIPAGEAAALDEATSDIFGTMVEFRQDKAEDPPDYLIGEKVDLPEGGGPLRYMFDPARDRQSDSCWTAGTRNKNPHYGSGVGDHFFFLLAEGSGQTAYGDSPTCGGVPPVAGIGRSAAQRIWYQALTRHFLSTTRYVHPAAPSNTARAATLRAAADLFGRCGTEYRAVQAAWTAVAVGGVDPACDFGATIAWSRPVPNSGDMAVHADGAVTFADCFQTNTYTTVNRAGTTDISVRPPDAECWGQTRAGADGVFYAQLHYRSTNQLYIAAMRADQLLWSVDLPDYGCDLGYGSGAYWLAPAPGGRVSVLINAPEPDCRHQQFRLLGLRGTDGAVLSDERVGPFEQFSASVAAHTGGVIIAGQDTIYRLAYSGAPLGTTPVGSPDLTFSLASATAAGRYLAFLTPESTQICSIDAAAIAAYDPGGRAWSTPIAGDCVEPVDIDATPEGGAVTVTRTDDRLRITRYDSAGTAVFTTLFAEDVLSVEVDVDLSGRFVVRTGIDTGTSQYVEVIVYTPTNEAESRLRIGGSGGQGRAPMSVLSWPLVAGRVYVAALRCDLIQWCNVDPLLYAVDVASLLGDYARPSMPVSAGLRSSRPLKAPTGEAEPAPPHGYPTES